MLFSRHMGCMFSRSTYVNKGLILSGHRLATAVSDGAAIRHVLWGTLGSRGSNRGHCRCRAGTIGILSWARADALQTHIAICQLRQLIIIMTRYGAFRYSC